MSDKPSPMDRSLPRVTRVCVGRRTDVNAAPTPTPHLSWTVEAAADWWQAHAEIRLDHDQIEEIADDESVQVAWPFPPLHAHTTHTLEVRVTGTDGGVSEWSTPFPLHAAFLEPGEWKAQFVGATVASLPPGAPSWIRTEFEAADNLVSARLYSSAMGVYQVCLNGRDVDDHLMKPGWTSYQFRLLHDAIDATMLVRSGRNALGIRLAGGWWTEEYGFAGTQRRVYGERTAVAVQLHLFYADGREQIIASGDGAHWTVCTNGPLVTSGLYAGEAWDARRQMPGWSEPGFDDHTWSAAETLVPTGTLEPAAAEPVRRLMELPVQEVITSPSGKLLLDFGQNIVGRLKLRVAGSSGQVIRVRHAEVLEQGELSLRPLRRAAATDSFILSGEGTDEFEPEFTIHGFRYVQVDGWPETFDPGSVTAVVVGSDLRRTGWFECSHPLVNRLHENVVWSSRGNFLSIPTDCPQRDERLGWTGDIQIFAPTAGYLFNCDAFLASWLRDLQLEQASRDGVCPIVVPSVLDDGGTSAAAWGDAATIIPFVLHQQFADRAILLEQYESMRSWVEVVLNWSSDRLLWESMFQFGDWLDPTASPDRPEGARTHPDIVASAYLIRSLDIITSTARYLGRTADATRYAESAERARAGFTREYLTPGGRLMSDAATAYALTLQFDIIRDETLRGLLGQRLSEIVRENAFHLPTGFVGTPLLLDALTENNDLASVERLLLQEESPSWLYPVTMGATTIWERWDSMLPDGTINPGEMTSFNHYAFGAVADWLHRRLGGIAPAEPGYRRLRIAPLLLPSIAWANAQHDTPYGPVSTSWRRENSEVRLELEVPANCVAEVLLPGWNEAVEVGSGLHSWAVPSPAVVTGHDRPGIDSSLAEIASDRFAYRTTVAAVAAYNPTVAEHLRARTKWVEKRSLRQELASIGLTQPFIGMLDAELNAPSARSRRGHRHDG